MFYKYFKLVPLILLFVTFNVSASEIKISNLYLQNVETNFDIQKTDSIKIIKGNNVEILTNNNSKYIFRESGYYKVEYHNKLKKVLVLPGIISIIPPLVAIILAFLLRQVLVSLLIGIFIGALLLYNFNPVTALLRSSDVFILGALTDSTHILIMSITLLIGGVVGVISKNGGTEALATRITKYAKTPSSGMLSGWLMGIIIFFDEYANTLIIGNMAKPISDKLKISREKLAYIIDTTAASTASIAIISTWIGYEIGLISEGLKIIGLDKNSYEVFLQTIPSRFYPIASLIFVAMIAIMRRDFGPMYKAEKKVRNTEDIKTSGIISNKKQKGSINAAIPISIFLIGTIIGIYYTGVTQLKLNGITEYGIRDIISNSSSNLSLFWSCFIASIVAILLSVSQKLLTLEKSIEAWHEGVKSMVYACIILVFAWGLSSITVELHTADYLISLLSDNVMPELLPAIIFVLCAITSFATGTSWGTMAIVMPIAIPLSFHLSAGNINQIPILYLVISSVLAGAVFGDHCSPISDTTILSSMAAECNHLEHVKTQMPYAITVAILSVIMGYIPVAFGMSSLLANIIIIISMFAILYTFGKKV